MSEKTANDVIAKLTEKLRAMYTETRNLTAFTYSFKPEDFLGKADITLDFSGIAYLKQHLLVANHKDEIAWHGIVRISDDRKTFRIEDIMVYPQAVTGATVSTDEVPYQEWKNKLNDDQYNHLRYQAHSHVNMATSPSGVDTTLYDAMLSSLGPTSYYIFLIINKRSEFWVNIYDMQNNVIYDKCDIKTTVEGVDLDEWYKTQIDTHIKTQTWQQQHQSTYVAPGFQAQKEEDEKKIVTHSTSSTNNTAERKGIIELPGQTKSTGKFVYNAPYEIKGVSDADKALIARYEQLRKNGAKYPIFCVGCKHARKFNPNKAPCRTCDVLLEAQLTDYANSQR
jgi:Tfp pilus assembly major pilin PilA